jgi:hypothetical protein
MNEWQSKFAAKIGTLREKAAHRFERVAASVLEETHQAFVDFASRHEFQCSTPQAQNGLRAYKFALTEDGFVLVYFRAYGIAEVASSFECYLPGRGRTVTREKTRDLAEADAKWIESCFQTALDEFVDAFSKHEHEVAEPVLV